MLNKLAKEINRNVRTKGFWNSMDDSLDALRDHADKYGDTQNTVKATKDAFISQKIALIQSECGEALEAIRKNNYGIGKKDSFEDEIADTIIRLLDLCGELNIDIDAQIEWKMGYNATREKKHGKEF